MNRALALLFIALLTPAAALAANDGTLGTDSRGDFDITLTVTDSTNIRISGLEHYNLDYTFGDPLPPRKDIDFCVYMDQPGTYSVSIDLEPLTDTVTIYPYDFTFAEPTGVGSFGINGVAQTITGLSQPLGFTPRTIDDDCATEGVSGRLELELSAPPTVKTTRTATATIQLTVTPD